MIVRYGFMATNLPTAAANQGRGSGRGPCAGSGTREQGGRGQGGRHPLLCADGFQALSDGPLKLQKSRQTAVALCQTMIKSLLCALATTLFRAMGGSLESVPS